MATQTFTYGTNDDDGISGNEPPGAEPCLAKLTKNEPGSEARTHCIRQLEAMWPATQRRVFCKAMKVIMWQHSMLRGVARLELERDFTNLVDCLCKDVQVLQVPTSKKRKRDHGDDGSGTMAENLQVSFSKTALNVLLAVTKKTLVPRGKKPRSDTSLDCTFPNCCSLQDDLAPGNVDEAAGCMTQALEVEAILVPSSLCYLPSLNTLHELVELMPEVTVEDEDG
jgi:hypothetical protein